MAIYSGTIAISADDYDDGNGDAGATIYAEKNNLTSIDDLAYAEVTSDMPAGIVTAVTVYWKHQSYAKSKDATNFRQVKMKSGATDTYGVVWNDTGAPPAAGTLESTTKMTGGNINHVNPNGKTTLMFEVGDPGGTYYRTWGVRSYDYSMFGVDAAYIVIEYTPAVTKTRRVFIT